MGFSLRRLGRKITDIFDANSAEDQRKRLAAGQPRYYADQQRQLGNNRPAQNVGQAFFGNTARVVNTLSGAAQETPGTLKELAAQLSGNKVAESNAVDELNKVQERTRQLNAGLLHAGTIYNSPTEKLSPEDAAKRFAPEYVGAVGEAAPIPAAKAFKGANLAVKAGKVGLASGTANLAADAGYQIAERGKIDPKRSAIAFGTGTVLGAAAPLAGAAVRPVIRKAGDIRLPQPTPLNQEGKIQLPFGPKSDFHYSSSNGSTTVSGKANKVRAHFKPLNEAGFAKVPGKSSAETSGEALMKEFSKLRQQHGNDADFYDKVILNNVESKGQIGELSRSIARSVEGGGANITDELNYQLTPINHALQAAERKSANLEDLKSVARKLERDTGQKGLYKNLTKSMVGMNEDEQIAYLSKGLTGARDSGAMAAAHIGVKPAHTKTKLGLKKLGEGGYVKVPGGTKEPKAKAAPPVNPDAPVPLTVTNKDTLRGQVSQAFLDKEGAYIDFLKKNAPEDLQQFYFDTGTQKRSNAVANKKIQDSDAIKQAFGGLTGKSKQEFDAYTAARAELSNASRDMKTSRPVEELQATVASLDGKYGKRHEALTKFYQGYADYLHQTGHITDEKYAQYKANPDYTRIQRDIEDLAGTRGQAGNSYSFGPGGITSQKRKGSGRAVQPADLTAFKYAQDVEKEVARNQTASHMIDTLEGLGFAKQISAEKAANRNVIKRRVNGVVEHWEVPRDIKEVADNVTPFQLGTLARIVSFPQRLLRAGATGLSVPFTAANYIKDQASSAVVSKSPLGISDGRIVGTHAPQNIVRGLMQSMKDFGVGSDDPLWEKFAEHLGDTTQYDFIRNAKSAKDLSREVRLGGAGRAGNMIKHPIRTLEDLNQITEKATRFQNFKGVYEKVLKETGSAAEAERQATVAAWQNSVDFSRMGDVAQAINLLVPYFNAGIQGTRTLGRAFKERPVATSMKTVGMVGLPLMGLTLYNVSDENRKKVYDNISDYEKENNIIVVLPGAKQLKDGSYEGVIKVPLQPGLTNLVQPIRIGVENYANKEPADVPAMAKQFLGALSGPINTSSVGGALGSITPQAVKPMVQQVANKDLFTGKEIVADYVNKATDANGNPVPENKKAYDFTSGSSRFIGDKLGVSPIRVDKFIKDTSGKVGQYTQNAVDNALAKKGVIPSDQVGGVSVKEDLVRRFARAQGKENFQKSEGAKYFDNVKKVTKGMNGNEQAAFQSLHPNKKNFLGDTITDMDSVYNSAARLDVYNRYPKVFEADKKLDAEGRKKGNPGNPLFDLQPWQVKKVLEKENLPPGADDKELSKLHDQEWYDDYSNKKSKFFTDIQAKAQKDLETAKKKGDKKAVKSLEESINKFSNSDNPYPVTPPDLQKVMDGYSKLPKGTGARKAWIQSNPGLYAQMKDQYAKIDNWQNKQRTKRGLDTTEGDVGKIAGYGDSSSNGYSKSGGSKKSATSGANNPYEYSISIRTGGKAAKPTVKQPSKAKAKIAKKGISKPKISIKKSLV